MNLASLGSTPEDRARRLGREFAPLFYGFVRYIMESAAETEADRVYYFTREGDFFAALHDAIARHDDACRFPESRVLPVSRLATFAASLREVSLAEMDRIWWLYPNQSFEAFLKSIALSPQRVASILPRYDLNLTEPIPGIASDGRVARLFEDAEFLDIVRTHIREKRDLLNRFLDERGISSAAGRAVVVDIGWKGSIQANLAILRPQTRFEGFYFAVTDPGCALPPNMTRRCFLDDVLAVDVPREVRDALFRIGPLELLCNSPDGTVIGYEPQDDHLGVLRRVNEKENATFRRFTEFFQQGVFDRVDGLVEQERTSSPSSKRRTARRLLAGLLHDPPRQIADEYLRLHHDETFGLGRFVSPNARIPWSWVLRSLVSKRARRRLNDRLNGMGWPAGSLVASNLRPLLWWIVRKRYPDLFKEAHQEAAACRTHVDRPPLDRPPSPSRSREAA